MLYGRCRFGAVTLPRCYLLPGKHGMHDTLAFIFLRRLIGRLDQVQDMAHHYQTFPGHSQDHWGECTSGAMTNAIYIYIYTHNIYLAEVPGFARGILRTIKYKCAIIAHHERKAGEMPISSVIMTKRCTIFTWIHQ